jgi:septum formation protein
MLLTTTGKYRIILASRSPRRQQLLRELGYDFSILEVDFDETFPEELSGEEVAAYIARKKALFLKDRLKSDEIIITADTVVWCNGHVLGKPVNTAETISMLKEISGKVHEVITGVSIISLMREVTFTDVTRVTFEEMTDEEIEHYAIKFNPVDKAGAYGIQEWIGLIACSRIEGSYFNVVGLPVHRLYAELKKMV